MTIIQRLRALLVICQVANQQGITVAQCRAEMTAAIRDAWSTTDPEVRSYQTDLVGDSHIPTPEELIFLIFSKNA